MAKQLGKKPERSCVVCRKQFPKDSLLRVVTIDGSLRFDSSGKAPGRGAYVCSSACWSKNGVEGMLSRALKTKVSAEDVDELTGQLQAGLASFPE